MYQPGTQNKKLKKIWWFLYFRIFYSSRTNLWNRKFKKLFIHGLTWCIQLKNIIKTKLFILLKEYFYFMDWSNAFNKKVLYYRLKARSFLFRSCSNMALLITESASVSFWCFKITFFYTPEAFVFHLLDDFYNVHEHIEDFCFFFLQKDFHAF